MVTFSTARDVLQTRLEAVFDPDTFGDLYPDIQAPKVFQGFPVNETPFYVAVDEIVDTATTTGGATMGHASISFTLRVWLFARHSSLKTASDAVLAYSDAVFKSVLADQRLDTAVDNSFPRIESAGTAADSSKRYVAAAVVEIDCEVFSKCPAKMMEVVDASNSTD